MRDTHTDVRITKRKTTIESIMCVSRPTNDETNTTCLIFEAQDTQKQEEIITKSQKNSKEETFSFLYQFKKKKPAHHHSTKLKVKKPIVAIVFSQLCPYCTHTILLTSWQHFSRGNRNRRTFLRGNNFVFSIGNCFFFLQQKKKRKPGVCLCQFIGSFKKN